MGTVDSLKIAWKTGDNRRPLKVLDPQTFELRMNQVNCGLNSGLMTGVKGEKSFLGAISTATESRV